jgi:VWFA-related protein
MLAFTFAAVDGEDNAASRLRRRPRTLRTMRATRPASLILIACALFAAPLPLGRGQDRAGDAGGQVLRVQTRLVLVNAVVHDKQGRPVSGLTRDDFTILDGGKDQPISFFSVESSRSLGPPLAPLPVDEFSNRVGKQGGVPTSVTVILLDGLNSEFADQAFAREQIMKFLAALQPGERVALYTLGNHLTVIQDFTSDPAPLLEAIREYRGRISSEPGLGANSSANEMLPAVQGTGQAAEALAQLQAGIRDATTRVNVFYTRIRVEKTLEALESIACHLSGLPGRKSLIWVSGGFPPWVGADPRNLMSQEYNFTDQMRRVAEALNQADVAIYPVDARGLFTNPDFNAQNRTFPAPGPGSSQGAALAALESTFDTMRTMADQTGGREFINTNDIQSSIRAAFDDASLTYTLGYYPNHGKWDGEYRLIKVLVKRPGATARYRRGYFAGTQAPIENQDAKALIAEAGQDSLEATAVGVTARLKPFKSYVGEQISLTTSIDAHDLTFEEVKERWSGSFDLWAVQCSQKGKTRGGVSKSMTLNLKEDSYQKILREGLSLSFNEKVWRGSEKLLVIVQDNPSGKVGWVNIPLREFLAGK